MPAAAYPTNNPLIDGIAIWARDNAPKLSQLYSVKGGWEGWAQAELCLLVPQWIGGSCSREDREVYTNNDVADFFHENPLNGTKNIVELKCQSFYQDDANIAGFSTVYSIDAGKIQAGNRQAAYNTPNDRWYVVGIAPGGTQEGGAVQTAIARFSDQTWAYYNSTHWTQRDQNSPMIFWTTY